MKKICFYAHVAFMLLACSGVMQAKDRVDCTVVGNPKGMVTDFMAPFFNPIKDQIKRDQYAVVHNPYKNTVATVRTGDSALSADELVWREQRFIKVKKAQELFLGMELADDEVLDIAISLSGGGYRAMIGALGSMSGVEHTGLLNCIMTIAGLSGSTWFLAPWITSGLSVAEYKKYLLPLVACGLNPQSADDLFHIIEPLLIKFAFNQVLSVVDVYGALLANALLRMCGKDLQHTYLAGSVSENAPSQADRIIDGNRPLPVYTAILSCDNGDEHEWFEFTPYEVGSRWLGAYVPTWALGRKFKAGISTNMPPEQSLGCNMGIFGSAFAVDFEELYNNLIKSQLHTQLTKNILNAIFSSQLGDVRLICAEINNFTRGMKNSPLADKKIMKLYDAGVAFGNPIFATYRNAPKGGAPDIILAFDYSSQIGQAEIQKVADYAYAKGMKFPCIDDSSCDTATMTVFKDDTDLEVPVCIYMPRIKEQKLLEKFKDDQRFYGFYDLLMPLDVEAAVSSGYANLFNFYYSQEQAEQWSGLTEFNLLAHINDIRQVMKERVLAKRG